MNVKLNVFWAGALFALAGCSRLAVRDLLANREKILGDTMSPDKLSPEVRKAVEDAATGASFTKMVVMLDASVEESGRVVERRGVVTLVNASKGLVERQEEWSQNDVPFRINNYLTYGGFLPLRYQEAHLARDESEPVLAVRAVVRFTPGGLRPVDGKAYEYEFRWKSGDLRKWACKAGSSAPASAIHTGLKGEAVPLTCEIKDARGAIVGREDHLFLEDYGVAISAGSSTSQTKAKLQVVDVKITN
jgi:hypothetical protein